MTDKFPTKSTLQILTEARAVIADPKHWTRGSYAKGKDGYPRDPTSPDAYCFCGMGAIHRVAPYCGDSQAAAQAIYSANERCVVAINDEDGHEAVLASFDRAIALQAVAA